MSDFKDHIKNIVNTAVKEGFNTKFESKVLTESLSLLQDERFIAYVINKMPDFSSSLVRTKISVASSFAEELEKKNSSFNREVFFDACGINDPSISYD